MENEMRKTYRTQFHLTKSKLVRLTEVLENSFARKKPRTVQRQFDVRLSNTKEATLDDVNKVFLLDNGKANKVVFLSLFYHNPTGLVHIEYDGEGEGKRISISVNGTNVAWINQTFSEIEEQVERTITSGITYLMKRWDPTILAMVIIAVTVGMATLLFTTGRISTNQYNLPDSAISNLLAKVDSARTVDRKIDALLEIAVTQMKAKGSKSSSLNTFLNVLTDWKSYLLIVPVLLILALTGYNIVYCYPSYVFEWGDMEEIWKTLSGRRKTIWNLVFGSLIIGIISNLFVFALAGYIK